MTNLYYKKPGYKRWLKFNKHVLLKKSIARKIAAGLTAIGFECCYSLSIKARKSEKKKIAC